MQGCGEWTALWRRLVEVQLRSRTGLARDPWEHRARDFNTRAARRWGKADTIRDFVASQVDQRTTVLDIGAGAGQWARFLAPKVHRLTALDPSPSMLAVLRENLTAESIENVEVIEGSWPEASVEAHDIALCSHAMYFSPDLPAFVRRMTEVSRRACYLVLRLPSSDGIMAEASRHVWGHPHDSPNFVVAYNALLEMGIYPNALIDQSLWRPWESPSLEDAMADLKRRLDLGDSKSYDDFLIDILKRHLVLGNEAYVWPASVRSALIYWDVAS